MKGALSFTGDSSAKAQGMAHSTSNNATTRDRIRFFMGIPPCNDFCMLKCNAPQHREQLVNKNQGEQQSKQSILCAQVCRFMQLIPRFRRQRRQLQQIGDHAVVRFLPHALHMIENGGENSSLPRKVRLNRLRHLRPDFHDVLGRQVLVGALFAEYDLPEHGLRFFNGQFLPACQKLIYFRSEVTSLVLDGLADVGLLGVEEVVKRALADSGCGGDLLHGHVRHAILAEQRNARFEHLFPQLFALICIKNPDWRMYHPLCE